MLHRGKLLGDDAGIGAAGGRVLGKQTSDDVAQLGGHIGGETHTGGGGVNRCICNTSGSEPPENGGRPASIANNTPPRL